jgi:hypothetical protein
LSDILLTIKPRVPQNPLWAVQTPPTHKNFGAAENAAALAKAGRLEAQVGLAGSPARGLLSCANYLIFCANIA